MCLYETDRQSALAVRGVPRIIQPPVATPSASYTRSFLISNSGSPDGVGPQPGAFSKIAVSRGSLTLSDLLLLSY
ncbi:hypothetical protein PAXRUDRAFT_832232 [Paxillus rubicundulus Ve08.2h10]|uniref:Uncharacterized protein n=1 Tax=Paxillus rubicundulus Ve08.2h10 TaxID=930991 RepID=A0A0D0DKX6_9AGAM|nr:hypothetical protein PAXRUDRAFT_832232 [Paxillus rubicundulus Ve08.2h10]